MNHTQGNLTMWPFDQPPNCATMTTTHVMQDGKPITRAYHDEADHGWQFFSDHEFRTKDAMIVLLSEVVKVDASLLEVADLPPGWMARREKVGAPWHRSLQYADAPEIVVDWARVASVDDFFDSVFPQCESPSWHGRNLDPLADSWVTGGINQKGPPYAFVFLAIDATPPALTTFRDAVLKIAQESINENGGRMVQSAEQTSDDIPRSN